MDALDALYEYLTSKTEVTSLVGAQIYPDYAKQGTSRPYIIYYQQNQDRNPALIGDTGSLEDTIFIEAWADTRSSARAIREALRDVLNGFQRQTMGTSPGIYISFCDLQNMLSDYEKPEDNSGTPTFVERSVYRLGYKESLTSA